MLSYWILLAAPVISGMAPYRLNGGARKVAVGFGAILLILMIGLRYRVGCDWFNYIVDIDDLNYTGPLQAMEIASDPGYGLVSWLCLKLNLGIYGVNFFCAVIFTWGLFAYAGKQPLRWLTIVVAVPMLIIVVAMGFTRQAAAIGFLMLAFAAFGERNLVKFLIFVALATTFHKTAVIMAPLAIIIDPTRRVGPLIIGGAVSAALVAAFLTSKLDTLTHNYIGNAEWEGEGAAAIYRLGLNLGAAAVFFLCRKRWREKYDDIRLYFVLSLAAVAAFPFAFVEPVAADRMSLYLLPYQAAVFARLPDIYGRRLGLWISLAAVIATAALMVVWFAFANNSWCWKPYGNLLLP
ncbi:MAG TPA: EpsG family protein [Caulobacteraceae bacterium]|jgi:hypothetical protein|nr:EpsG family protein [Caulobacteraceae bacterium]